jgi:hypothetical protein
MPPALLAAYMAAKGREKMGALALKITWGARAASPPLGRSFDRARDRLNLQNGARSEIANPKFNGGQKCFAAGTPGFFSPNFAASRVQVLLLQEQSI